MSGFDPTVFANFGVLGVLIIAAIMGWIWFKPSIDKLTEEKDHAIADRDKAMEQRDVMAAVLQEKLLPVVGDFITTTRTLLPILQQLQQLQQMIPILQELIRSINAIEPPEWERTSRPTDHRRGRADGESR